MKKQYGNTQEKDVKGNIVENKKPNIWPPANNNRGKPWIYKIMSIENAKYQQADAKNNKNKVIETKWETKT